MGAGTEVETTVETGADGGTGVGTEGGADVLDGQFRATCPSCRHFRHTNIDRAEDSISSGDWDFNVTVTKRGPPKELVPIRGGLGSYSDTTIGEELNSADFIRTQSISSCGAISATPSNL